MQYTISEIPFHQGTDWPISGSDALFVSEQIAGDPLISARGSSSHLTHPQPMSRHRTNSLPTITEITSWKRKQKAHYRRFSLAPFTTHYKVLITHLNSRLHREITALEPSTIGTKATDTPIRPGPGSKGLFPAKRPRPHFPRVSPEALSDRI